MSVGDSFQALLRDVTDVLSASARHGGGVPAALVAEYAALQEALGNRVEGRAAAPDQATVPPFTDPDVVQLSFHMALEADAVRRGHFDPARLADSLEFMARHVRPVLERLSGPAAGALAGDRLVEQLAIVTGDLYRRRFAAYYARASYRRPFVDKLYRDYRWSGLPPRLLSVMADLADSSAYDACVVVLRGALGYAVLLESLGFPSARLRFVACGRATSSHLDTERHFEPLDFGPADLRGRRVLIVDNNVLTGDTLRHVVRRIAGMGPSALSVLVDYVHPTRGIRVPLQDLFDGVVRSAFVVRDSAPEPDRARRAALLEAVEAALCGDPGTAGREGTSPSRRAGRAGTREGPAGGSEDGRTEVIRFVDVPQTTVAGGLEVHYAPMRLEWRRAGAGVAPLAPAELSLRHTTLDPFVIQVQVTQACNLACQYCTAIYNPRATLQRTLDRDEIRRLRAEITGLPPHGLVILMGGEPFLEREAVFQLVEAAGVTTVIFTNGTLLTGDDLRRLHGTRAVLLLSVDGDEQTTAVKRFSRRQEAAVDRVFGAVRMVADSGLPFGLSMVLGSHNIDRIDEQVERLHERFRPASFGVSTPHYAKSAPGADQLSPSAVAAAYVRLFHLSLRRGIYIDQVARRLRPFVQGIPLVRDCSATGQKRVYYPGGVWVNCCNQEQTGAGLDAWARRLPVFTPSCHACLGIGVCGGGCVFDGEKYGRAESPFDPRHCATVRALVAAFLDHVTGRAGFEETNRDGLWREFGAVLERPGDALRFSAGHTGGGGSGSGGEPAGGAA